eukprot:COSAG02_NODE_1842_length_10700_cov_148.785869_4_plen_73_part_00
MIHTIEMKIREQVCDSKICISKFKFNCDEIDKSIPNPLPQNLNHFMMIVGKPGIDFPVAHDEDTAGPVSSGG